MTLAVLRTLSRWAAAYSSADRPHRELSNAPPHFGNPDSSNSGSVGRKPGVWHLTKCAINNWSKDQSATLSAALAFYCAFSLAPLLVILVTVIGWIVGAEAALNQLTSQLSALFGQATADVLLKAVQASQTSGGVVATILSVGSLVIGATTVFAALEETLEQIWGAPERGPSGIWGWVHTRILSFGVILSVGFLLLVSLFISTALTALRTMLAAYADALVAMAASLDLVVSVGFTTVLIALIYRYLPAKKLAWKPILIGALITALLFNAGRWAIGLYLGRSTQPSAFGAAASFAALLLWLYYSAQIFLLGAEFTACLGGSRHADEPLPKAPQGSQSRERPA
jgi:membrane protein